MPELIGTPSTPLTGLFKYFSPNTLDIFEKGFVSLTPPKYFNDPWDLLQKAPTYTDEDGIREWQKLEKEIAERPDLHPDWVKLHPEQRRIRFLGAVREKDAGKDYPVYFKEKFSEDNGVVCFTEKPLCRLMWGHYGKGHKGFVAEFAIEQQKADGRFFYSCLGASAAKIAYAFKWETFTSESFIPIIWSKHPDWKYEAEWRIIWPLAEAISQTIKLCGDAEAKPYYFLRFEPTNLKRVIFGLNMDKISDSGFAICLIKRHTVMLSVNKLKLKMTKGN